MKYEREFEDDITPTEAYRQAEKFRMGIPYERYTQMYEGLRNNDPEGYEEKIKAQQVADYYRTRGLFDMALRHVTFDMVMTDVSVIHLRPEEQLKRIEAGMERYATDEAYRSKYAGMARG